MPDRNIESSTADATKRWTTRELLHWMSTHFRERSIESPRVCAEMLLSHVLDCERMRLYMEVDRTATATELATLRDFVRRAGKHEPVQYLVGHAWFFARKFEVGPATLIPRPSTETLVELGVRTLREIVAPIAHDTSTDEPFDPDATIDPDATVDLAAGVVHRGTAVETSAPPPTVRVLDLCTGTGCIAISIATSVPSAVIVATDIVPEAISLAQRNATEHAVADRIEFRTGSLWSALEASDGPFDLICANPPYVSDAEWVEVPPNVKDHEPPTALRAGADGLEFIRPIVAEAMNHLAPGGTLLVEISFSQGEAATKLAKDAGFGAVRIERDHEGHDRVLMARRSATA